MDKSLDDRIFEILRKETMRQGGGNDLESAAQSKDSRHDHLSLVEIEQKLTQTLSLKSSKAEAEIMMRQQASMSKQIKEIVQLVIQKLKISVESQAGESK